MTEETLSITVWQSNEPVAIPRAANPSQIAALSPQLSPRDVNAITAAFEAESYEMVSTYVWARASAALKKQIAGLGMEFVGEMLGRPDISESSDPATSIGDYEAISLAEDLGMITTTEAMRLKHGFEAVTHFADPDIARDEEMTPEEAVGVLRSCVSTVLGTESIAPPVQFVDWRRSLETESIPSDDARINGIVSSPYFFKRTTLSALLSLVKTGEGAQLEHAIGNTNVIVPAIWPDLRSPEKWQVGQSYAEVTAAGRRSAAVGLKKVLTRVHGFDFVPETLRSNTFSAAAHRVMEAHFGWNNFYNEGKPMRELANLGSTIPRPAFPVCMTATLCVRLGNAYGVASDAQSAASSILDRLRREQWEYFLNECLASDKTILEKLSSESKPLSRWFELVEEFDLGSMTIDETRIRSLVTSDSSARKQVTRTAMKQRKQAARQA